MSEPLVIEPEKSLDWSLRTTVGNGDGSTALQGESLRILGLVVSQHHALIQQTFSTSELS